MGMVGSLLFASAFSGAFESDVKEWRLFADIINDVGLTLGEGYECVLLWSTSRQRTSNGQDPQLKRVFVRRYVCFSSSSKLFLDGDIAGNSV
jgi:hypothetical protein